MGTGGGPFPGVKRGRGVTLATHPHLMPRSRMRSYTSPLRLHRCVVGLRYRFSLFFRYATGNQTHTEFHKVPSHGNHNIGWLVGWLVGSLFNDDFSVTRLYSVEPQH
jgi:hypothetical protein